MNVDNLRSAATFTGGQGTSDEPRSRLILMQRTSEPANAHLRRALQGRGHRYTEQRAAVYRFLLGTTTHPSAAQVFQGVRDTIPAISLATVYKSLETLVRCGLAERLTYGNGSARYDARTEPHHHARCLVCGRVMDVPGQLPGGALDALEAGLGGFSVLGYRLELTGRCPECSFQEKGTAP